MIVARPSRSTGYRAGLPLHRALPLLLACLVAAAPAVVRAQCADYGGSFRVLGAADLPDYGKDVAVGGDLAYVVSGVPCATCIGRLDVFDVSTVGEPGGGPSIMAGIELPGGPVTLAVLGERAYVGASGGALHVVDVSDPFAPSLVTTLQTDAPVDLAATSGLLFAATDSGLQIYDLADPDSPARIGSRSFAGGAKSVALSGSLAFVVWGGFSIGGSALSVLDVSDPTHPSVLSSIGSTAMSSAVAVSGDRAFLGGGFRYRDMDGFIDVIDVSDPMHPVLDVSLGELRFPVNSVAINGDAIYATAANPWSLYGDFYVVDASGPDELNLVHAEELEFQAFGPCVANGIVYYCEDRLTGSLHFATAPGDVRPKALARLPSSSDIYSVDVQADLAYLVDSAPALKVMDLSDPADPQLIGSMNTPSRGAVVAVQGNFAYVGYPIRPIDVVDVSNPQSPQIVASVPQAPGVMDIVTSGPWLYAIGWNGLRTIDISNPVSPVARGYLAIDGIAVVVESVHAYILDGYSFSVVDVSNPAAPVLVGSLGTQAARALALSGHHAFVVDWHGVQIIDVADPALPVEVGRIAGIEHLNATRIGIQGDHAYLARNGMAVVDVRDPLRPTILGESETEVDVWPRDVTAGEDLVLIAGENLTVFPVQCPVGNIVEPRSRARALAVSVGPNPMRDETRLELDLDPALSGVAGVPVRVWVMDVAGRHVARLADGPLGAGRHVLHWDGRRDWDGRPASAGVYWLRVDAAGVAPRMTRIVRLP